jgi:hypothetical protein
VLPVWSELVSVGIFPVNSENTGRTNEIELLWTKSGPN